MAGEPRRVLVLHSRVGGGHTSAARAIAAELAAGGAHARLVDVYLECGRFPLTLFPAVYARIARDHRRLWAALFYGTNVEWLSPRVMLGPFLQPGVRRTVRAFRPHLIVSVLPLVNGVLSETRGPARLEVVLTDWDAVHRSWVAPGVDYYTAPTDSARQDCIGFGAAADRVEVVGLPVRREFAGPPATREQRTATLERMGLAPDRFTVLIMVGAEGSPNSLDNVRAVLSSPMQDTQVLVVAGRNEKLRQQVAAIRTAMPRLVVGFVDNVAELMRAADVLVTKAGGLTLAEALCSGVPIVVQDVLPGQEEGNLAYLSRHAAVESADRPSELARVLVALRNDEGRRHGLAQRGALLARPNAATHIAAGMLERLARAPKNGGN